MAAPFVPLKALQTWYDDTAGYLAPRLYLLDATVTSLLDSYSMVSDLPGLLPTGGGYNAAGLTAGNWPLNYDTTSGVMELSLPDTTWSSTETLSLTFRWVVITITGGYILCATDFGAAQTLTAEHLTINATESAYIPNSYPVFRWRKA